MNNDSDQDKQENNIPNRSKKNKNLFLKKGKWKHLNKRLDEGNYILFDIENTGGNPEKNGITEICALKVYQGQIEDTFYTLINPKMAIPPIVRKMTGITNKLVRNSPTIYEVMPSFVEFIEDHILVSHNTIGDIKFLRHFAYKVCQVNLSNYFLCTHLLAEKLLKPAPDKSLRGLTEYIGVTDIEDFHRAEGDAHATKALFENLLRKLKEKNIARIEEAIRFQGDFESALRLGWSITNEEIKKLSNGIGVYILKDKRNKVLFLSATENIQSDFRKLSSFKELPKQLLKCILQTDHYEIIHFKSLLEAFIYEANILKNHSIKYSLINWNQKSGKFLFLVKDKKHTKLVLGPVVKNAFCIFGPIVYEKSSFDFLFSAAKYLNAKPSSNSIIVDENFISLFKIMHNKGHWDPKIDNKEFDQFTPPELLYSIETFSGVYFETKNEKKYLYFIYKGIACGKPFIVNRNSKKAFFEIFLFNSTRHIFNLKEKVFHLLNRRSHKNTFHHINRVSWWVVQGIRQRKAKFYETSDLKSFSSIRNILEH